MVTLPSVKACLWDRSNQFLKGLGAILQVGKSAHTLGRQATHQPDYSLVLPKCRTNSPLLGKSGSPSLHPHRVCGAAQGCQGCSLGFPLGVRAAIVGLATSRLVFSNGVCVRFCARGIATLIRAFTPSLRPPRNTRVAMIHSLF